MKGGGNQPEARCWEILLTFGKDFLNNGLDPFLE